MFTFSFVQLVHSVCLRSLPLGGGGAVLVSISLTEKEQNEILNIKNKLQYSHKPPEILLRGKFWNEGTWGHLIILKKLTTSAVHSAPTRAERRMPTVLVSMVLSLM